MAHVILLQLFFVVFGVLFCSFWFLLLNVTLWDFLLTVHNSVTLWLLFVCFFIIIIRITHWKIQILNMSGKRKKEGIHWSLQVAIRGTGREYTVGLERGAPELCQDQNKVIWGEEVIQSGIVKIGSWEINQRNDPSVC